MLVFAASRVSCEMKTRRVERSTPGKALRMRSWLSGSRAKDVPSIELAT